MNRKQSLYEQSRNELEALLEGTENRLAVMATINGVLSTNMPHYFWTGFYIAHGRRLIVGPYQGSVGCLYIDFGRGVCGTAAEERKTQIVEDVHLFPGHIACDQRSQSEIVVPVFDRNDHLIAVFDVDSSEKGSFDETDRRYLEAIMAAFFGRRLTI